MWVRGRVVAVRGGRDLGVGVMRVRGRSGWGQDGV